MIFHEQQECVYDFPSQSLATCASVRIVFKQEWPKIVRENHTHTPAVMDSHIHTSKLKKLIIATM